MIKQATQCNSFGITDPVVKFTPVIGTDTIVRNGVTETISTRFHCITEMEEYKTKSLEELRLKDWEAGRKGYFSAGFGAFKPSFPVNDKLLFNIGHNGSTRNVLKASRKSRHLQTERISNTSPFGQTQLTIQTTPFGQTTNTANTDSFVENGTDTQFNKVFIQEKLNQATPPDETTVAVILGTVVKFTPVIGSDTMVINGVTQTISTRHYCITYMKEYETKSLEELRLEDYTVGRKGAQTGGMFGATPQASPFGGVVSQAGPTNTAFGGGMTTGFGATSQAATTNFFSKPLTGFGAPTTTTSAFTTNNSPNNTNTSNIFNTQAKPFGATTGTPLFSTSNTVTTQSTTFGGIGTQNTGFGGTTFGAQQQPNQSIDMFHQSRPTFNLPASTVSTSTFGFGQTSPTNTASMFGSNPIGTTCHDTVSTPAFGQTTAFSFGASQTQNTLSFNTSFKPVSKQTTFSFNNTTAAAPKLGIIGTALFSAISKPNLINTTDEDLSFIDNSAIGTTSSEQDVSATSLHLNANLISMQQRISELEQVQKELLSFSKTNSDGTVRDHTQQNIESNSIGNPPLLQYFSQACIRVFLLLDGWIINNWIL